VVDEHAGELVADGALDERGRHGRVDTAGQAADHALVADGARIAATCSSMTPVIVQVGAQPATSYRKCSSTACPCSVCSTSGGTARRRGRARGTRTQRRGVRRGGDDREARRRLDDGVTVRHPDRLLCGEAVEERVLGGRDGQRRAAVLADPVRATVPPSAWAIAWKP
jgi:hypothetical protein